MTNENILMANRLQFKILFIIYKQISLLIFKSIIIAKKVISEDKIFFPIYLYLYNIYL